MAYQQQQQGQDSRNPNRLHLNFGGGGYQQQNFAAEQGRAFPTTPSTFPQPFPNAAGQQEVWGTQQTTSGINSQGYFYNNPNPYQQQQQQYGQQGATTPGGYRSPQTYDVTNGLAHQFQHQNLGGNTPRSASPYNRQPSPASGRPRTGGQQQQQYGSYLGSAGYQQPQGTKHLRRRAAGQEQRQVQHGHHGAGEAAEDAHAGVLQGECGACEAPAMRGGIDVYRTVDQCRCS